MNKFYIYILINSIDNAPIYIGKGKERRAECHFNVIKNRKHHNLHLQNKVLKIWENGGAVLIKKFYTESEQEAFDIEVASIKYAKQLGYKLCNFTDGGEGSSGRIFSKESKKKSHNSMKKYHQDHPEIRKKQSEIRKKYFKNNPDAAEKNSNTQKKYFKEHPEARKKNSEALKKYYKEHPEAIKKLRKKRKEYFKNHPEAGKKHGETLKKYFKNPEARLKNSEAQLLHYKFHPERKRHHSIIMKGKHPSEKTRKNK
jgi:hypothetical protein